MPPHPRLHGPITLTAVVLCLLTSACSKDPTLTPEYQAACHGDPLHTVEERNQALEDGYTMHPQFNCITRASHLAMLEAQAQREAWRSAEAVAKRKAETDARSAEVAEARERKQAEAAAQAAALAAMVYELRHVDVNTATESDIAAVCSIGPNTAADITRERESNGPFADWANLVHRVVGVSSAQNAVFASTCGLNVNGESLNGAPADADAAQALFQRDLRRIRP